MNKHSPAFTEMLLFYPGIRVRFFMFLPLLSMFAIILFFSFMKIPDESKRYAILSPVSYREEGVYSFIYNTDSIWKSRSYYLVGRNNELIDIEVVKVAKMQSGEYEIRFLLLDNWDSARSLLNQGEVEVLPSKTFLGRLFSFFMDKW